ncbi:MAG: histidine phosphatase family protein [Leptolyngbyaceae cyanobacterium SL_5_14]|nr:histidine phosphatase family protein [Leptolyngbyaceae cyanobacterium SL_5_14]
MKLIKLLFIRHAQSVGNRQKRMQGHRDFGLSTEGIEQAKKLAQRLVLEHKRPNYIYSSPLKRAAQTTEILLTHALSAASTAASSTSVSNSALVRPQRHLALLKPKMHYPICKWNMQMS